MDVQYFIDIANNSVYPAQGLVALYGVFCVILVFRRIYAKQFKSSASAEQFIGDVKTLLGQRDFDGLAQLCASPPYWSKAVPQLILVALQNKNRDPGELRRLLAEKFERDVLADLAYRMSWINTVVKTEPMLGLLGTVLGMISAFGKISLGQKGGADPSLLAGDISFALVTTAVGLIIAIPLVLCMSLINVRLGRLQDGVQQHLGAFLDEFETVRKQRR